MESQRAIRFKVPWQGHPKGSVNRTLGLGIMQTLVECHRAEWVEPEEPPKRRRKSEQTQE